MSISISGGVGLPGKVGFYTPPPPPGYALFGWGAGDRGRLGDGTDVSKSSPIQIGDLEDWANVSVGSRASLAVKTNGELWTWGYGFGGQLGLGDTDNRSSPVQIGALTDWVSTSTGGYHSHAIKTDGSLWSWGRNSDGALGLGNSGVNRSSPSQVGGLSDWLSVVGRSNETFAIKTNGSLWAWGLNLGGNLGLGNIVNRSSPVQVGALTDWVDVTVSGNGQAFATRANGTLWAWGSGNNGQLGLGDANNRSSPTQIGILTDWANVSSVHTHTLALKTDGSLWAWGENFRGQLGLGDAGPDRSSPVQVGSLTDWASINTANTHSVALKTDGTLWAWGQGNLLGHGLGYPDGNRSSPVQIGALNTWFSISTGTAHTHAIQTT